MSVKVQVTGRDNRAVTNADVFVKWKSSGPSRERTNNSGIADLRCSGGTIEYITVRGAKVSGSIIVGNDEMIEVVYTGT